MFPLIQQESRLALLFTFPLHFTLNSRRSRPLNTKLSSTGSYLTLFERLFHDGFILCDYYKITM